MILKLLLSIQTICMMFTKILMNTILIKKIKKLIVFDDMIADMIHNKKLNSIVTFFSIVNCLLEEGNYIFLLFLLLNHILIPKDVRLNTSHSFIAKIPNKRELQQIAINHSSDINTKDFANIYRRCTAKPYSFLVVNTMLASNNLLRFRKNLLNTYDKNHDN